MVRNEFYIFIQFYFYFFERSDPLYRVGAEIFNFLFFLLCKVSNELQIRYMEWYIHNVNLERPRTIINNVYILSFSCSRIQNTSELNNTVVSSTHL